MYFVVQDVKQWLTPTWQHPCHDLHSATQSDDSDVWHKYRSNTLLDTASLKLRSTLLCPSSPCQGDPERDVSELERALQRRRQGEGVMAYVLSVS